jgi:hypothetical protein
MDEIALDTFGRLRTQPRHIRGLDAALAGLKRFERLQFASDASL